MMKKQKTHRINMAVLTTLFLSVQLNASDQELDSSEELLKRQVSAAKVEEAVISLNLSKEKAHVCAISGPQVSGTKDSMTQLLTFLKGLLEDDKRALKIQLKQENNSSIMYTLKHHYGPYHEERVKSWYSDTGPLDKKEFTKTLDEAFKKPEENSTIIMYGDLLVVSVLAGTRMNAYIMDGDGTENYYHFYDLALSQLDQS